MFYVTYLAPKPPPCSNTPAAVRDLERLVSRSCVGGRGSCGLGRWVGRVVRAGRGPVLPAGAAPAGPGVRAGTVGATGGQKRGGAGRGGRGCAPGWDAAAAQRGDLGRRRGA